jgi:Flp pilus assembly protein protease CpaA
MIEIIVFAFIGSALAGLWDLKTTEVPDEIPAVMISVGLFYYFIQTLVTGDPSFLVNSFVLGTAVLAAGLVLYKLGKWGGADAWILASIAYLLPIYEGSVFMLPYISNLLFVSSAYMIVYALILGIKNTFVFPLLLKDLKGNITLVFAVPLAFVLFSAVLAMGNIAAINYLLLGAFAAVVMLLVVFWRYALIIEDKLFRKKIPVNQLKEGDVLESMIWRGLTMEEVSEMKKQKKEVVIKEGVRFVPVFPITLALTIIYGNLLYSLL